MKLVIFGLTVSSSWGNGHATLWRGLIRSLAHRGHRVVFFEKDVPWYAAHRDALDLGTATLVLYGDWNDVRSRALVEIADADAAVVTSYQPDGAEACRLVLDAQNPVKIFYDLDTPVTLDRLNTGEAVPWLPREGLGAFDVVLSYTGGRALTELEARLGARRALPLYGSVDPDVHCPAAPRTDFASNLSYLGTYAPDRQAALEELLLQPARKHPEKQFLVAGAQYPDTVWPANVKHLWHVSPTDHSAFYASSPLTLSITRKAMAAMGHCPSGRLFEAAACGVPVLSDPWEGLDRFFTPGEEILVGTSAEDTAKALALGPTELARIGRRARERALDEHTAEHRASELVDILYAARTVPAAPRIAVGGP
jgi:spore maturation protein CgeB